MIPFMDVLVLIGMILLRVGIPAAVIVGLGFWLRRLDRRWEAEARLYQESAAGTAKAVEKGLPAKPKAPEVKIPFIPPPRPGTGNQIPLPAGIRAVAPGKPCWDVKGCSKDARAECAASQNPQLPCWQARLDAEGVMPPGCPDCEVARRYPVM